MLWTLLIIALSETTDEAIHRQYGFNFWDIFNFVFKNDKKVAQLEGETRIRPGEVVQFSPHAENFAYITIRTATETIA